MQVYADVYYHFLTTSYTLALHPKEENFIDSNEETGGSACLRILP